MSKQIKFRRGTTAQHAGFTGALGEVTVDTDKDVPVVHDGVTAGGVPLAREDRPRGWIRTEIFTYTGSAQTWTQTGKTDLKRIRVTAYGGGGGGGTTTGGGGGAGGAGVVTLETSSVTTNVTVTIGAGGGATAAGGTTSFGTYISATGGGAGSNGSGGGEAYGNISGGAGGTATGTGVLILGGQGGASSHFQTWAVVQFPAWPGSSRAGGQGGGMGGGQAGRDGGGGAAKGITGSGGGNDQAGAPGSVIVEEIYGLS
jgi:hypothetical protein